MNKNMFMISTLHSEFASKLAIPHYVFIISKKEYPVNPIAYKITNRNLLKYYLILINTTWCTELRCISMFD